LVVVAAGTAVDGMVVAGTVGLLAAPPSLDVGHSSADRSSIARSFHAAISSLPAVLS
jgi:hypothetical protein